MKCVLILNTQSLGIINYVSKKPIMVEIHSEIVKAGLSGRREDPGKAVWKLPCSCHLGVTPRCDS